jgi:hypothetical protein
VLLFYKTQSQHRTILTKTYTQKHIFCPKIQRYAFYLTPFIKLKTAISTISPFYFAIFMKFLAPQKQLKVGKKLTFLHLFHTKKMQSVYHL